MPLSKVEREVLEVICEEHRQTHRGAKALIVHVGMNAKTGEQKARIVDVLHALQKRGLLVAGADTWLPTTEGKAALAGAPAKAKQDEAPKRCGGCDEVLTACELTLLEDICLICETKAVLDDGEQKLGGTVEHPADPLPDDLLNRFAVMNATLLAQAEQAYVAGDPDAWRDLAWLIETGKQLVAIQEVNHG